MPIPVEVARSQIGIVESGGPHGNDGNIVAFWDWWDSITGEHDQGASWCGAFVSFCFDRAGARFTIGGKPGFIYCPAGEAWFRSQGLLRDALHAQPGDVAFFDFNEHDAHGRPIPPPHHTGIVEAVDAVHRTITCIEGNTSNGATGSQSNGGGVYRRTRPWMQVRSIGHVTWVHPPSHPVEEHMNRTTVSATPSGVKATFTGLDQKVHPVNFTNVVGLVPIDKAAVWALSTSVVDDQAVIFADPATAVIVTFT